MAFEEVVGQFGTQTTRRTIVKTGVKLAYAAPLVAASFKLGSHAVLAAVSGECQTPFTCGDFPNNVCGGTTADTPSNEVCACFPGVDGSQHCGNNHLCGGPGTGCTSDAECASLGAGYYCGVSCCGPICIPPCGVRTFSDASVASTTGIG